MIRFQKNHLEIVLNNVPIETDDFKLESIFLFSNFVMVLLRM